MNILFLTQIIPYPPDAGPRLKTWNVLRHLAARGHRVTLASFVRPEEEQHIPHLKEVCAQVFTVPMRRSRLADLAYGLWSYAAGRPFLIERDDLPAMRALVRRVLAEGSIDLIHCDQVSMTQYALPYAGKGPRTLFDAHNAVWTIFQRMSQQANPLLRLPLRLEARRMRRYEQDLLRSLDRTLAVTDIDRELLLEGLPAGQAEALRRKMTVIPIVVDALGQPPVKRQPGSRNIITLGTLHYPPNADGIRWFFESVFPLIQAGQQDVTLTIVGKNPPPDFSAAADRSGGAIRVTGYVPDLTPYLEAAALMVVPVRAGGGMRVRILEAFVRGMPVVTTSVGLEGIDARPGEEVLVE
ncbi:glycosyltransferase, partial [bacterium]